MSLVLNSLTIAEDTECAERADTGQVTVFGKGGKTRAVLLSPDTWEQKVALRGASGPDDPVIRSRKKGGALTPQQVGYIVRQAARRAGIEAAVSPHWLRHAHASHNLDRGTPIHLVQATLGHASVATTGRYLHARPNDSSGGTWVTRPRERFRYNGPKSP